MSDTESKMEDSAYLKFHDFCHSEIKFFVGNGSREILRLCPNGDIYVRGKLATNDAEVVDGLRGFLNMVKIEGENKQ